VIGRAYRLQMNRGARVNGTWEEHELWKEIVRKPAEKITEHELASLRAYIHSARPDAIRTELGNVLAAVGRLGSRRDDGSREATCPCGRKALLSARGRFKCSGCTRKTKAGVLRALVETRHG